MFKFRDVPISLYHACIDIFRSVTTSQCRAKLRDDVATTEAGDKDNRQDEMSSTVDSFDGIDWSCLPGYMKPLA
jgi:hypothetical protein